MVNKRLSVALVLLALVSLPAFAADWPQLLGPTRDGVVPGKAIQPWPSTGPKRLWSRPVGAGFAGPAVAGGRVLLFHRIQSEEILEAIDPASGKKVWRSTTPTAYRDDFGFDNGPRVVPVIDGDRVFTVGAEGRLTAWNLDDGEKLWQRDTAADFAVPKGFFGVATGPLVIGERVLLNVGGKGAGIVGPREAGIVGPKGAGIVAFDRDSGKTLWQATADEQSYSSPTLGSVAGRPAALFFTREGLVAVEPSTGVVLTRFAHKTRIRSSVNAATPLVIGNRIFVSAEYGAGAALLDLPASPGASPTVVWSGNRSLSNHYATSVYLDGTLYGFHGRQESSPSLRAVDFLTGDVLWSEERFGAGSILLTGNRLLILAEEGVLTLAEASRQGYRPLAQAKILDGVVRSFPAVAGGVVFARSPSELVAVRLAP